MSVLKRTKKYDEKEDEDDQGDDDENEKGTPRNRDYKGKDKFGKHSDILIV